jgi:hypothetical protein
MKRSGRQRLLTVALAASLVAAPGVRAQIPAFPIPIGPDVLAVPLLLLLLGLGMKVTPDDEKTVRELERRGDVAGVIALADKRLAERANELTWREIRGWALQHSGRCALAMPDLRYAFEQRLEATPATDPAAWRIGLALGLCEMLAWQLEAAAVTMTRLAALAPGRWEPPYNLALMAAQRGDTQAMDAAVAQVAALDGARAAALRRELAVRPAGPREATAPPTAAASSPAPAPPALPPTLPIHAAVQLNGQVLRIGDRALELPQDAWVLQSSASDSVRGTVIRRAQLNDEVSLVTVRALATTPRGALAAAISFTANPRRAYGTGHWDGEDFCAVADALHVDRFKKSYEKPECVYVRLVDAEGARPSPRLGPVLVAAAQAGVSLPERAYEIHYSLYGQDWMVASTWLLPSSRLLGSLVAVQWARDLAAQMSPLARTPDMSPAVVPPLGPASAE